MLHAYFHSSFICILFIQYTNNVYMLGCVTYITLYMHTVYHVLLRPCACIPISPPSPSSAADYTPSAQVQLNYTKYMHSDVYHCYCYRQSMLPPLLEAWWHPPQTNHTSPCTIGYQHITAKRSTWSVTWTSYACELVIFQLEPSSLPDEVSWAALYVCFQQILVADLLAHEQQQHLEHTHSQAKGVGWGEGGREDKQNRSKNSAFVEHYNTLFYKNYQKLNFTTNLASSEGSGFQFWYEHSQQCPSEGGKADQHSDNIHGRVGDWKQECLVGTTSTRGTTMRLYGCLSIAGLFQSILGLLQAGVRARALTRAGWTPIGSKGTICTLLSPVS